MQNKHNFFLLLLSVSQPPGRGSSRLVQKTKFVKGNISGAPLREGFKTPSQGQCPLGGYRQDFSVKLVKKKLNGKGGYPLIFGCFSPKKHCFCPKKLMEKS